MKSDFVGLADFIHPRLALGFHLNAVKISSAKADFITVGDFILGLLSLHLGHCNTEITSNIYVHIFKEYKAKMAESIEHDLL